MSQVQLTQYCFYKVKHWVICMSLFSPIVDNTPQVAQMLRQGPTAPEYSRTAFGEMKMPEPIIVPTIRQTPLNRPTWKHMTRKGRCYLNESHYFLLKSIYCGIYHEEITGGVLQGSLFGPLLFNIYILPWLRLQKIIICLTTYTQMTPNSA